MSKLVIFETTLTPSEVEARLRQKTGSRCRLWPSEEKPLTGHVAADSARFNTAVFWLPSRKRVFEMTWRPSLNGGTLIRGAYGLGLWDRFVLFVLVGMGFYALVGSATQNIRSGNSPGAPIGLFLALAIAGFLVIRFDSATLSFGEERLVLTLRSVLRGGERLHSQLQVDGGEVIRPHRRSV